MSRLLYKPLTIGSLKLPGNLFAAPMAGYSDAPTRALALEGGADLAYTEMISAEALIRGSARTRSMTAKAPGERFLALQLFGADPDVLGRASCIAADLGADILDLNAGCPVPKVTAKGAGSALMRDPVRLGEAVSAMAETNLPVTVKIRSGWDENEITWKEAAEAAQEAGAAALGLHPRTRSQGYGGSADWNLISSLVTMSRVPVIGSGDLDSPEQAVRMLEETACAGIMFARGAVGDPGIYSRTRELLKTGNSVLPPSPCERIAMGLRHLESAAALKGAELASKEMKKHLAGYIKGWENAAEMRLSLMRCQSYEEIRCILREAAAETR